MDFASALVGGLVGGVAAAVLTGIYTLTAQSRQHQHERHAARDARLQERRAGAYERILEHTYHLGLWVERVEPEITIGTPPPPPDPIPDKELLRLNAITGAHATHEVRNAALAVSQGARRFQTSVWRVEVERKGAGTGMGLLDAWNDLEARRKAFRDAVAALETIISNELAE